MLDDCWSEGRYENRTLRPNFQKFPNGMAHVANAVHNLDMRFGMYSSAGKYTCGQYEGSLGYETEDATTWASWGVDYLKYMDLMIDRHEPMLTTTQVRQLLQRRPDWQPKDHLRPLQRDVQGFERYWPTHLVQHV